MQEGKPIQLLISKGPQAVVPDETLLALQRPASKKAASDRDKAANGRHLQTYDAQLLSFVVAMMRFA